MKNIIRGTKEAVGSAKAIPTSLPYRRYVTQVFEREKKLGSVLTTVNSHLVEEREDDDEHDDHPWGPRSKCR
jgi:hypothetical protein